MEIWGEQHRPAGYGFLIEKHGVDVLPNWHTSFVGSGSDSHIDTEDGQVKSVFPRSYWPGDSTCDHFEFALKYDGVNLGILYALFAIVDPNEVATWIAATPNGKYCRKIWFLYEFLTGTKLALPDLTKGNYVELLEPDRYFTTSPGRSIKRQRIIDNLLGPKTFCPIIRRTKKLSAIEDIDLAKRLENIVSSYPREVLRRALNYLYNKETKSSFEIEHINPSASRAKKFIGLLEMAEHKDFCEKTSLINLQNRIVDPRFCDSDYRIKQNYVGQTISHQREVVHYICPKPEDLSNLMAGLFTAHQYMKDGGVFPIIHAAAVSYGFVYIHPFEDGNGRIHRFLIHNILYMRGVTPKGLMFPVSAAMLKNRSVYDRSLEAFSKPLLNILEYDLDDAGQMKLAGKTGHFYRYIDMTAQAEALSDFIQLTIEQELVEELDFLKNYDETKRAIQEIVDMPDRLIDLFIQLCLQNNFRLSVKKRETHFSFLKDDELTRLETAVREGYTRG
ncbi:MAG: Fic family protein [Deltaproteobacteria bacterium]|nr:Fic family protein [Deltaproteobacteria bacterium]